MNEAIIKAIALQRMVAIKEAEQAADTDDDDISRRKWGEADAYNFVIQLVGGDRIADRVMREFAELSTRTFQAGYRSGQEDNDEKDSN